MVRAMLAFAAFAAVVTVTPGLDTMVVLRVTTLSGRRAALAAVAGIQLGCLSWALATALGVSAVLVASRPAFETLRFAGAAYLCWLGLRAWRRPARVGPPPQMRTRAAGEPPDAQADPGADAQGAGAGWRALRTGLTTNLLNPKVGAFYLSVLPQFLPDGVNPLLGSLALAAVHDLEGVLWLSAIVLVLGRARAWFARPVVKRRLEQVSGAVLIGFGVRLATQRLA
jgi:threonine/homoserine/homoserine lactone efflux protein